MTLQWYQCCWKAFRDHLVRIERGKMLCEATAHPPSALEDTLVSPVIDRWYTNGGLELTKQN
jgi:hypothetical protein